MKLIPDRAESKGFVFASSIGADAWHRKPDNKSYEWWYFDALSDHGDEAVVITFLDNFIFSPRYNSRKRSDDAQRYPAVAFTYFKDGKALYHSVNEYKEEAFECSELDPACRIGENSFNFSTADYGSGYLVNIRSKLSGDRVVEARFEWLMVESDLSPEPFEVGPNSHYWNMAVARADVTGRITVYDRNGSESDVRHFRGTGYHDHNFDNRWLAKTLRDWHWGRVHFADTTAVFYRYCEVGDHSASTRLLLVRDGELIDHEVDYEEQNYVRDKFGIRYPTRLRLISGDNVRLRVKPLKVIDSNFYYLRFLSEFTLSHGDSESHTTLGITEFIAPKSLKYRWLNWLNDIRTGKNGKAPFI